MANDELTEAEMQQMRNAVGAKGWRPGSPIGMTPARRREILQMSETGRAQLDAEAKADAADRAGATGGFPLVGTSSLVTKAMSADDDGMTAQRRRELLGMSSVGRDVLATEPAETLALSEDDASGRPGIYGDVLARQALDELVTRGLGKLTGKAREFVLRLVSLNTRKSVLEKYGADAGDIAASGDLRAPLMADVKSRMSARGFKVSTGGGTREGSAKEIREIVASAVRALWRKNPPAPGDVLEKIFG